MIIIYLAMTMSATVCLSVLLVAQVLVLNNAFILNRPFVATGKVEPLWEARKTNAGFGGANDDKPSVSDAPSAFVMPEYKKEASQVYKYKNSSSALGSKSVENSAATFEEAVCVTNIGTKDKESNATNKALAESAALIPNESGDSKSVNITNEEEISDVKTPKAGTPAAKAVDALKNASDETQGGIVLDNDDKPPPVNVKHDSSDDTGVLTPKSPVTPSPDSIYDRTEVPPLEQETMKPNETEKSDATVKANLEEASPKMKIQEKAVPSSNGGKETAMGKDSSDQRKAETTSLSSANESNKHDIMGTFDPVQVKDDTTISKPSTMSESNTTIAATPTLEIDEKESDVASTEAKSITAKSDSLAAGTEDKEEDVPKPLPKAEESMESVSTSTADSNLDGKTTSPNVSKPLELDTQATSAKKDCVPDSATKVEMKVTDLDLLKLVGTPPAIDVKSFTNSPSKTDVAEEKDEPGTTEKKVPAFSISEEDEQNQSVKVTSSPAVIEIPIVKSTAPTPKTEERDTPKLDPKPDTKRETITKLETSNAKSDVSAESTKGRNTKDGMQALSDLFFGSLTAKDQDNAAVIARIKSRKQAKEDERKNELSLSQQLQESEKALENFKREADQTVSRLRAETEENRSRLLSQLNEMAIKLEVAEGVSQRSNSKMQDIIIRNVELESEVKERKELYASESSLWTDKYDREREYRRKEQIEARERLSQVMAEAREQLRLANEESAKRQEMIRSELTKILEQNKQTLSYTTIELKQAKTALVAKNAQIEELSADRDSLRGLAREFWALIKKRTKRRWNKLRGKDGEGRQVSRVQD